MTEFRIGRREVILAATAFAVTPAAKAQAEEEPPIHVVKGRGCECCEAWVDYLREQGFTVTDEVSMGTLLIRFKMDQGIPAKAFSCHTGTVDGYALEGHVPAADIRRLWTSVLMQLVLPCPACLTAPRHGIRRQSGRL